MSRMEPSRGCWTCKERKVLCDRGFPECSRCKTSNHKCQGYGVRLAWRLVKGGRAPAARASWEPTTHDKKIRFVNATHSDLELHHHLSSLLGLHERNTFKGHTLLKKPPYWTPFKVGNGQETLVDYFISVASKTLAIFDPSVDGLRNIILRLAFSDDAPASEAVLRSLLAVSSVQRNGPSPQADRLKLTALRALRKSSQSSVEGEVGIQQAAAQMLLCSFEVKTSSAQWPWYLCAANYLIKAAKLGPLSAGSELQGVVDWVAYQHVICRFSLQNWWGGGAYWSAPADKRLGMPTVCEDPDFPWGISPSREILLLLSDVIESVQNPSGSEYYTNSNAGSLQRLEDKLESFQSYSTTESGHDASADITELYRLASLIYLERAFTNSSGPSAKVQRWLDKAYHILEKQNICQHPFLLLILGIESHNDAQRKLVLNLIHQADVGSRTLAMENAHRMLQAVWLQDDLETERVLDYRVKLKAVLSVSEILPSLA